MLIKDSRIVWQALNGIICVYKPAKVTSEQVRRSIITNICKELCEMQCRPPEPYVTIEGETNKKLFVRVQESLADHPLVVGPRYQNKDLRCSWTTFLGRDTSGVMLYGLNEGTKTAFHIRQSRPIRTYRITGKFGEATDNLFKDGKVVEKSTYKHIKQGNLERLLSSMQASHQRKMFELCGVEMNSQAGYELAIQGPIRPSNSKIPILYGIKCVYFELPYFILEIQAINEYETYLKTVAHEVGMQLRSTAHCIAVQCIRHSYFTIEDALLSKHWQLQYIFDNMMKCNDVLKKHTNLTKDQTAALQ